MNEYCARCDCITETALIPLASRHIGRVCAVCHSCRKGKPYAKKSEYQNADGHATRGHNPCRTKRGF